MCWEMGELPVLHGDVVLRRPLEELMGPIKFVPVGKPPLWPALAVHLTLSWRGGTGDIV